MTLPEQNLQYKVNITDRTLIRLKEYDSEAWHKLMFVVLSESNENLVKEINELKTRGQDQVVKEIKNG
jgi:hypothetical protein